MKPKDLKVPDVRTALNLMKAFLSANMLDNELIVEENNLPAYVRLARFTRNVAEDDVVGCPCFLCDYEGYIPGFNKVKKAIVYVKAFGTKTLWMTKMFFVEENQPSFYIDEIKDGDSFTMDDGRRYVYRDGVISLLS